MAWAKTRHNHYWLLLNVRKALQWFKIDSDYCNVYCSTILSLLHDHCKETLICI